MVQLGMTGIPNRLYKQNLLLARLGSIIPAMFTEIDLKQPIRGFEPKKKESKTDDVAHSSPRHILRKHIMIYVQYE